MSSPTAKTISLPGDRYFIINKPRNMVSQFVSSHAVNLLGSLDFPFPEGIHAIGRLDNDSEGLLILTTNKKLTAMLFQGGQKHERTYLVLVKNTVHDDSLERLRSGIPIRVKGGVQYQTQRCEAVIENDPATLIPWLHDTIFYPPFTWLRITLKEGKFHQVRKMVSAIHHPCRRLIRISIGGLELGNLPPGQVKELDEEEFFRQLQRVSI